MTSALSPENAAPPPPPAPAWPIGLLGVPFDNVTKAGALARIEAMIATGRPHQVVTANVDFLVQAQRDVELRRILIEADLVVCDGTPLVWASHWLGNPLPERVAGADLVPLVVRAAAEKGHRLFFLGAGPGVAAEAAERLQRQHPALVVAGHYSPPFRDLLDMDFPEIARRVAAARPDVLLVSFGCPKQEKWIAMHFRLLNVPVVMGVGATLDFMAGRVKRAPALMQETGTEWIFRWAQEPRRLSRRYLEDIFRFAPSIGRQWWSLRAPRRRVWQAECFAPATAPGGQEYRAGRDFSAASLGGRDGFLDRALQSRLDCRLDLSEVRFFDSTGVAVLVRWHQRLRAQGKRLVLLDPSAEVRRALRLMRLAGYFPIAARSAGEPPPADGLGAGPPVIPPYPGGHTVGWQGEITAANAESVWDITRSHLTSVGAPPHQTFIINLSRLRFIDSAGAQLMGRLRDWARQLQKDLRFIGSPPDVRNVLRLAKLGGLLEAPGR